MKTKLIIAVLIGIIVVLSGSLLWTLVTGPNASVKIMSWFYTEDEFSWWENGEIHATDEVTYHINITNDGHAVGNATIRCEIVANGTTYYATQVISVSPGEVKQYRAVIDVPPLGWKDWYTPIYGNLTSVTCRLITF